MVYSEEPWMKEVTENILEISNRKKEPNNVTKDSIA